MVFKRIELSGSILLWTCRLMIGFVICRTALFSINFCKFLYFSYRPALLDDLAIEFELQLRLIQS